MTGLRSAALRQLALMFIAREVSSDVDPAAVATAARRAYEALVRVLTPLIGAMGVPRSPVAPCVSPRRNIPG